MKVLHIYWSLMLGGIETMLVNILNEQVNYLNKVYLIIINDKIDDSLLAKIDKRVVVILLKRKEGSFAFPAIVKLNYFLLTHKVDVIHSHYNGIINFIFPLYWNKTCVTLHAISQEKNSSYLYKYRKVFSISESVRTSLYDLKRIESKVVYNGIDFSKFTLNNKLFVREKTKIVLVGRLIHEIKGQDLFIKAISLLPKSDLSQIEVDIIGDGPSKDYLSTLIKDLRVSQYVRLLGEKKQDYLFSHLCNYDLFVQPSYREGFGLTVVEAIASKVPVLVSENQGPLEIIANGKYGYTFNNSSVESCCSVIHNLLTSKTLYKNVNSAYNYAKMNFSIQNTAKSYVEEYRKMILNK